MLYVEGHSQPWKVAKPETMFNNSTPSSGIAALHQSRCEVCGGLPPPGHRFCDNCWPEAAIATHHAALCEVCGAPKVIEKLTTDAQGRLVCAAHSQS